MNHTKQIIFLVVIALIIAGGALYSSGKSAPVAKEDLSRYAKAVERKEVSLKNGDTYDLAVDYVVKDFGGKAWKMLAYNGSIPGPTIRVTQGDRITVKFTNKSDVRTLLHSHGVRMENTSDGSQLVQKEMEPGESFTYTLTFPDPGVFWYHPHVREDMEQALGLYANFIVSPKDPAEWNPVDGEEVLALGDVLVEDDHIAPFSKDFVTHALMGRFGNTMIVNGKPAEEFHAKAGDVRRFFITNVASVRTMSFRIPGASMKLVGADAGQYEKETLVDAVTIAPSERAIVEVYFPKAGEYTMEHKTPDTSYVLGKIIVGEGTGSDARLRAFMALGGATDREKEAFAAARTYLDKTPDKQLRLAVNVDMNTIMSASMGAGESSPGHTHNMAGMTGGTATTTPLVPLEWEDHMGAMNIYSTDKTVKWILRDEFTGKENMDINWTFVRGSLVKIRITNDPTSMHPMQHPFHIHGNRFLILAVDGKPNTNMAWKDTVLVQAGQTVDILVDMSNPGKWMAHCHIAEHLGSGMMFGYTVTSTN